ncbi:MAG: FHA domain-containing protein [Isosphaera sp.]|nr:FHA domain-containing protein [Isosphaera sp.]
MRARLVPANGDPPVDLVKDVTLVGRDEDCDVRLAHRSVSKRHLVLVKTDGLILLRDLGSTNGTRVNGQSVRRAALLPNDVLAIAALPFTVRFGIELERELNPALSDAVTAPLRRPHRSDAPEHNSAPNGR